MTADWGDLATRITSAVVMLAVAAGAWFAGPVFFAALVAVACGAMIWELLTMQGASGQVPHVAGAVSAAGLWVAWFWAPEFSLTSLLLPAVLALATLALGLRDRAVTAGYAFAVLAAGVVVMAMAGTAADRKLLLVLLAVVIVSDIAGYFAGRLLGGPKFWPRVSPKKTWSGTVAGWIASAVLVGLLSGSLIWAAGAVFMSFAAQMGDIAESAIKRRAGVKDASNLIPGHGGVLDRFDGVIGAALVLIVLYFV